MFAVPEIAPPRESDWETEKIRFLVHTALYPAAVSDAREQKLPFVTQNHTTSNLSPPPPPQGHVGNDPTENSGREHDCRSHLYSHKNT